MLYWRALPDPPTTRFIRVIVGIDGLKISEGTQHNCYVTRTFYNLRTCPACFVNDALPLYLNEWSMWNSFARKRLWPVGAMKARASDLRGKGWREGCSYSTQPWAPGSFFADRRNFVRGMSVFHRATLTTPERNIGRNKWKARFTMT